jgi:hypothetical protein
MYWVRRWISRVRSAWSRTVRGKSV